MQVEVWGDKNGYAKLLINKNGMVENGFWKAKTDKINNTIYVEYTQETHEAYYLGMVESNEHYNEIFEKLRNKELIPDPSKSFEVKDEKIEEEDNDEPPF